ncbi:MAG: hypothetical protein JEZ11_07925 [Desulfobacterales bacterium]|nr:hypothetical protein [Desulfobacterales bacterium]
MISFNMRNVNIVEFKVVGEFTFKEFRDAMIRFFNSPEYKDELDYIWDFRESTGNAFTPDKIYSVAIYVENISKKRKGKRKTAIIIRTDLGFDLAKKFQSYAVVKTTTVKTFKSIEPAEEWIVQEDE